MQIKRHVNREQWLNDVARRMAPWFAELGYPLPPFRVSIGFTSVGIRGRAIGQCWTDKASADGHHEIFIVPTIDDPERIADILAHELCHAAVGIENGHNKVFGKVARAIGLEGPLTATFGGDEFKRRIAPIMDKVGPLPHAKLMAAIGAKGTPKGKPEDGGEGGGIVSSGPKKQSARLLKAECDHCGLTVRITRKWIEGRNLRCPDSDCDGKLIVSE